MYSPTNLPSDTEVGGYTHSTKLHLVNRKDFVGVDSGSEIHFQQALSTPTPTAVAQRLRILLIVESSGAGTGRHVLDLADGLTARNCEVHLIYSTGRMDARFKDRLAALKDSPFERCC